MAAAFFFFNHQKPRIGWISDQIGCWLVNELTAGQETAFCVVLFVFRIISLNRPLLYNEADAPRAK